MSFFNKCILFFTVFFVAQQSTRAASFGDIECEGNGYPSCCTAIATSHGNTLWYLWSATKGYYDSGLTLGNYTTHHCGTAQDGGFDLRVDSYEYNDGIFDANKTTGLYSEGNGVCNNPNSN